MNLTAVTYSSRYALGLVYKELELLPQCQWSAKYMVNPVIRFACWDTAKRGSTNETGSTTAPKIEGDTLLLHTSVPFAQQHLEENSDTVQGLIQTALSEAIPGLPPAQHSHLVRWRYSQVCVPFPDCPGAVVLSEKPLVIATGDGFIGSNFENCLLAALRSKEFVAQYTQ